MKKYTYKDMPDKSKGGIRKEVSKGLTTIAFYLATTRGIPLENSEDYFNNKNLVLQLAWYMDFRNKHPELFSGF